MSASARDPDDVLNVAFDQWDQYATAAAAEGAHGITFGAFAKARLSAAGFVVVPREPTEEMLQAHPIADALPVGLIMNRRREVYRAMLSAAEEKK